MSAKEIRSCLSALVEEEALRQFGRAALPAVSVQLEQLENRFRSFAVWQERRFAQGWRIAEVEFEFPRGKAALDLGAGVTMGVTGKIDRIDFHPRDEKWAIFDYKTGDKAKDPAAVHYRRNEWRDLQLPLYSWLAQGMTGRLIPDELGYISIAQEEKQIGDHLFTLTPEMFAEALETAKEIARRVKAEQFWPPAEELEGEDEFAGICRVGVLSAPARIAEAEEGLP